MNAVSRLDLNVVILSHRGVNTVVCYRAALDRIAMRHAECIQPFRDVAPTAAELLQYGLGPIIEYMSAVYAVSASSPFA